jgi:hypothetical protein
MQQQSLQCLATAEQDRLPRLTSQRIVNPKQSISQIPETGVDI